MWTLGWRRKQIDVDSSLTAAQKLLFEGHNKGYWKIEIDPYNQAGIEKLIVRGSRSKLRYELRPNGAKPLLYNKGFEFCSHIQTETEEGAGMLAIATVLRKNELHFLENARFVAPHSITGFVRGIYLSFLLVPLRFSLPSVAILAIVTYVVTHSYEGSTNPRIEEPTKPGLTGSRIVSSR